MLSSLKKSPFLLSRLDFSSKVFFYQIVEQTLPRHKRGKCKIKFTISWYSEIHSKRVDNSCIISLTLLRGVVSIDYSELVNPTGGH